jgi:hypothetical protein
MIEVQLLKRSWYITQLQKNYKELMEKSRDEVAAYAQELYKFEHGLPYDPQVIQQRYMEMLNSFIRNNIGSRPVYVTCEIEKEIGAGYVRIPEGLVFRLSEERRYAPFEMSDIVLPKSGDFRGNDRHQLALRSFMCSCLPAGVCLKQNIAIFRRLQLCYKKRSRLIPITRWG